MKENFFFNYCSFLYPDRICDSTWTEHIPFGFWLISLLKPKVTVELGVFKGASYFSFCQIVQRLSIKTKVFGIDTWKGDEHGGYYKDAIYDDVAAYNTLHYADFSTLLRRSFQDAHPSFRSGSIDLLHIDGCHTYDAVKNDYDTWLPKLKKNGIVLFHDISVKDNDFGVHRFWDEIKTGKQHFEFKHGYGLGVLAIGERYPRDLKKLFGSVHMPEQKELIQQFYARLGKGIHHYFEYSRVKDDFDYLHRKSTEQGIQL
jgi:hypothetical protein